MNNARWLLALGMCAMAAVAAAQSAKRPDPTHPLAVAPPLRYESAFAGYRPLGDDGVGTWRQVNDRVREAADERSAAARGAAPAAVPAPAPAPIRPAPPGAKQ